MADTLTTTTTVSTIPNGTVIATDDAGAGGHVQIVKLAISTDGSATAIPAEASNGLDVDVTRVQGTVAVTQSGTWDEVGINDSGNSITVDNGGTFAVQVDGNALTALQLIDDAVFADDADWTDNTSKHINIGGVYQSSPHTVTDGDVSPALMDANGRLIVAATDNGGSITVDNGGTFAVQVDGNALTALQLIDDVVYTDDTSTHSTGTSKGALIMAAAAPTDASVNANDIGAVAMTTDRKLHVSVQDALPAGTNAIGKLAANSGVDIGDVDITSIAAGDNNIGNVDIASIAAGDNNIGNVDIVSLPASTNTLEVVGDAAHDAGAAGNPVLVAGIATNMDDTAPPNRVSAENDATRMVTDYDGSLYAHPHGPQIWNYHLDTSTAQTDTEVHAATGSATLCLYVTDIVFSSDGTAAINIFFEEGSTKKLGPYYLPATAGGVRIQFQTPKKLTANTALTLTTSASHAHSVDITGFTGQG